MALPEAALVREPVLVNDDKFSVVLAAVDESDPSDLHVSLEQLQ